MFGYTQKTICQNGCNQRIICHVWVFLRGWVGPIRKGEIENGPLDGIVTLFVWLGKHSRCIGLCRHHGQAETIWLSVLGQGHTSKAPTLRPYWLAARTIEFSISPEPAKSDRKWKPIFYSFRVVGQILPLFRLTPVSAYT